jgi:hypothetical protein
VITTCKRCNAIIPESEVEGSAAAGAGYCQRCVAELGWTPPAAGGAGADAGSALAGMPDRTAEEIRPRAPSPRLPSGRPGPGAHPPAPDRSGPAAHAPAGYGPPSAPGGALRSSVLGAPLLVTGALGMLQPQFIATLFAYDPKGIARAMVPILAVAWALATWGLILILHDLRRIHR